ncbi:MAG: PilT/PilU family type 4a pilus ATPase [Candidatus Doudnabacteria bacterium]
MAFYDNVQLTIKRLLLATAQRNASDLHLSVGRYPTLRIDGELITMKEERMLDPSDTEKICLGLLSEKQKERLTNEKSVDLSYEFQEKARFRINVFYQRGFLSAALRLVPMKIRTIGELGLPPILEGLTDLIQGLILLVGPSGHGKSTSLAALLDLINHKRAEHIITVEDPIEYLFTQDKSLIDQRELYQDTNSFPEALRAALREDPNVVMVGEMRDLDTIATAVTVAETGHLVFSTVHTNNAPQTIDRIIDVFPSHQQNQVRFQLANVLGGIVSQRLLPRIGGGLAVACEIMMVNAAIRNLIREQKTHQIESVLQTGAEEGMVPLDKSLARLVKEGVVDIAHALMYSQDPRNFRSLLK